MRLPFWSFFISHTEQRSGEPSESASSLKTRALIATGDPWLRKGGIKGVKENKRENVTEKKREPGILCRKVLIKVIN